MWAFLPGGQAGPTIDSSNFRFEFAEISFRSLNIVYFRQHSSKFVCITFAQHSKVQTSIFTSNTWRIRHCVHFVSWIIVRKVVILTHLFPYLIRGVTKRFVRSWSSSYNLTISRSLFNPLPFKSACSEWSAWVHFSVTNFSIIFISIRYL